VHNQARPLYSRLSACVPLLGQTNWVIAGPRDVAAEFGLHPSTLRSRLKNAREPARPTAIRSSPRWVVVPESRRTSAILLGPLPTDKSSACAPLTCGDRTAFEMACGTELALPLMCTLGGAVMLKITRFDENDLTVKLEGKLLEPWIGELESACGSSLVTPKRVCLDLYDLTFIDAAGARFLANLIRDGARVIACSGYVAEMLQGDFSHDIATFEYIRFRPDACPGVWDSQ
jgi:hypothetical protein